MGKVLVLHLCPPHHSVLWKTAQGPLLRLCSVICWETFSFEDRLSAEALSSLALPAFPWAGGIIPSSSMPGMESAWHVGVHNPPSEWEQHAGKVDFMCRSIQKRWYGCSEISAELGPKSHGAVVLGSSADPRRPITFRNSQPLFFHKEQSPGGNSDLKGIKFLFFKVLLFSWHWDKLCLEGQICKWIHMENSLCVGNIIQVNGMLWGHRSLPGPSCNLESALCSFKVKAYYKPQQYFF